jgi:hypothetical protein
LLHFQVPHDKDTSAAKSTSVASLQHDGSSILCVCHGTNMRDRNGFARQGLSPRLLDHANRCMLHGEAPCLQDFLGKSASVESLEMQSQCLTQDIKVTHAAFLDIRHSDGLAHHRLNDASCSMKGFLPHERTLLGQNRLREARSKAALDKNGRLDPFLLRGAHAISFFDDHACFHRDAPQDKAHVISYEKRLSNCSKALA